MGSPDRQVTPAVAAAAPAEGLAETLKFLQRTLPPEQPGACYFVSEQDAGGRWRDHPAATISEAARLALQIDAAGANAYFALATFAPDSSGPPRVRRRQEQAVSLRALFLDIDCGKAGAYATQEEARTELKRFCNATGLPLPRSISSGRGLHLHWILNEPVPRGEWQGAADTLAALCSALAFKADPACTTDAARVLRPVGTHWRKKDKGGPLPVRLLEDAAPAAFATIKTILDDACQRHNVAKRERIPAAMKSAAKRINKEFEVHYLYPAADADRIAENCAQLREMRDTGGCIPEPRWHACLGVLVHTENGDEVAHAWSRGDTLRYTHTETENKLTRLRDIGPTTCERFAGIHPDGCARCPHKGTITSPILLGRAPRAAAATVQPTSAPGAGSGFAAGVSANAAPNAQDNFFAMNDAAALALVMHAPTEDNVGRLFERQYSEALRYCKAWGCWLSWDGTRWRQERTDTAFDFSRTMARAANPSGKPTIARAAFAHGVEAFARAARTFATEAEQWDRDEFAFNAPGGTVDLRTGKMRPHDQSDYITKLGSVSPQPGPKPVFDKFMFEITCGDESLIHYHQRSLGAMLSGARADHWLLFWIGSGRNGKNTLGDLIAEIFGDYAKTIPTETLMSMKGQAHPTEIANLRGVRLAISSEVAEGAHWNESRIKSLTGDATLTGRFMRGDFFQFLRSHKHLIYGNNRPQLRVVDDAIRARMHVVPFRAMFSDELGTRDPLMGEKLRAEAPQILAWLIQGHVQFIKDGYKLKPCAAVRRETEDYLDTQSTPALWVKERCEVIARDERPTKLLAPASMLYADFVAWKVARGEHAPSITRWGEWMKGRFEKVQSDGVRYRGIRVRTTPQAEHYGIPVPLSPFSVQIQ